MPAWMDNSFWALVAFVLFFVVVGYFGVHKVIANMLDKRIAQIADELEGAKRLREEAANLLAEYERKRVEAEAEADSIVANAKSEAERMTAEAQAALTDLVNRRTRSVQDKIAQAEAQAVAEVRARSADLAIEAARTVLANEMGNRGNQVIDRAIADVGSRLN